MSDPGHVFSRQDHLFLGGNDDENLLEIERLRLEEEKLVLVIENLFKQSRLSSLLELLVLKLKRWKLTKFW